MSMTEHGTVVVGLSGGVDSAVAAVLIYFLAAYHGRRGRLTRGNATSA